MPEAIQNLMPQLVAYGVKIVGVLLAIWISFRVGAWIERLVNNGLRKREFDAALTKFFGSLARWLLITAAILACLGVFGIETTSFAAILGAAGLAIGLAFQGTLSNFAAGVMLLTFRPFRIGDYVKVASNEGTVAEIGLFVTSLDTLDNRRLILPNATIIAANIDNYTHHEVRRVDIDVGVAYSADLDEARRVLDAAAAAVQG
ncbi:MAG: mechanosensitive ion channel, partial [Myxococcales bacterium]|nr:mechanosensitive ion channel [Myxococcales bacterium]